MRSLLALAASIVIAGCATAHGTPVYSDYVPAPCGGEQYVEVSNFNRSTVEVYAYVEGSAKGELVGTAPSGTTRLSLSGTRAENKAAGFSSRGSESSSSTVRFRRVCVPEG